MRIAFDTEFIEDGTTIQPLSLGFVTESGQELYVVITDTDRSEASPWVAENVLPHLDLGFPWPGQDGEPDFGEAFTDTDRKLRYVRTSKAELPWGPSWRLPSAGPYILDWITRQLPLSERPEFWADYGSYDWVLLCQLFGRMVDLPSGWPMFVRDIQQATEYVTPPAQTGQAHNALEDARHVMATLRWIDTIEMA